MPKPYEISINQAAWLIYAFLKQPALHRLATVEALGGTISKERLEDITKPIDNAGAVGGTISNEGLEDITKPIHYVGAMGWFCRNIFNDTFPRLFLAFENGLYSFGEVPLVPRSETLIYPKKTFVFPSVYELSELGIKTMLEGHQEDPVNKDDDGSISSSVVRSFINHMPKDPLMKCYNEHGCSFFETRISTTLKHFLEIPGLTAVRYYFGYDDCDAQHYLSNRIRIIFVGVDATGKNIPPSVAPGTISYFTLQNSWPPPPPY